ncbi:MAG: efflux RND transporter periplasmic adaptor subunit [Salinimicrobium sp.]
MRYSKIAFLTALLFLACNDKKEEKIEEQKPKTETTAAPVEEVMLSQQQFEALDMKIDSLQTRLMSGYVEANGQLEVPPQNEASVTPVIGANVAKIEVIEGEQVKQGQVLAYIAHPEIIELQTAYLNAYNDLKFEEKEYKRQQKLYEAGVGSGESFQRSEAKVENARGRVAGFQAQLKQLHISPGRVEQGKIAQQIPVLSPIEGAVQQVNVRTGEFVPAQSPMFEIINTHHVHVDLMVFEKDVFKVKEGQEVHFSVASLPATNLTAKIISVSKNFEQDPKAVHVHAEIENRPENLVPGMYVRGKIAVDDQRSLALPESAVVREGEKFFAFTSEKEGDAWSFKPVEVIPGDKEGEWIAVKLMQDLPSQQLFAFNNAYYLQAEMNKGEGGHSH